jgi:hypothetical protein
MKRQEIIAELKKEADLLQQMIDGFKTRNEKIPETLLRDSIDLERARIYYMKLEIKRLVD